MQTSIKLPFNKDEDIPQIRQKAQQIAILVGLSIWDQARVITAVSEAVWAIFRQGGEGEVECSVNARNKQPFLQFDVRSLAGEQGDLARVAADELEPIRSLVDRFKIRFDPGSGLVVTLEKSLAAEDAAFDPHVFQELEGGLTAELPSTPLDEMRRQNQELLQLLAQLQEKETALVRQLDETRRLEKARDELIHTMIHDLRNPLTSVQTSLSGVLLNDREALSDYQRGMIEIAYRGTKKTVALVENILDVSRLEENHIPLDYAPISLPELVAEIVRSQSLLAKERDIRLEHEISGLLPPVYIDRKIIERVLQNLVDNALKFTPQGGSILISAETDGDINDALQPGQMVISVLDDGLGISDELRGRLFGKYVTGPHKERGSGLGLAFCKLAVEAHGGHIRVESSPGEGAKFVFTLPLLPPHETPPEQKRMIAGSLGS